MQNLFTFTLDTGRTPEYLGVSQFMCHYTFECYTGSLNSELCLLPHWPLCREGNWYSVPLIRTASHHIILGILWGKASSLKPEIITVLDLVCFLYT